MLTTRAQRELDKIDKNIPFIERGLAAEEIIQNLKRTREGVVFLSGMLQMTKAEVEKTETLPYQIRSLMVDCFGMKWIYFIPAQTDGKKFNKIELKTILAMMDEEASVLRRQKDYVDERDEVERAAEILMASLPSGEAMNNLVRYDAHFERQFYRALAELERRQARRKGEAVLPRMQVHLG